MLRGVVNSELVAALRDLGVDAVGLSGVDGGLLIGQRIPELGLVAHVVGVRRDLLDALLVAGQVPVIAPLARDEEGLVCNVNADDAAAGIAADLGARQLVLLTDVDGVRGRRRASPGDASPPDEAEALIADGTIAGGMVPKVRAALGALSVGRGRGDHRRRARRRARSAAPSTSPTSGRACAGAAGRRPRERAARSAAKSASGRSASSSRARR